MGSNPQPINETPESTGLVPVSATSLVDLREPTSLREFALERIRGRHELGEVLDVEVLAIPTDSNELRQILYEIEDGKEGRGVEKVDSTGVGLFSRSVKDYLSKVDETVLKDKLVRVLHNFDSIDRWPFPKMAGIFVGEVVYPEIYDQICFPKLNHVKDLSKHMDFFRKSMRGFFVELITACVTDDRGDVDENFEVDYSQGMGSVSDRFSVLTMSGLGAEVNTGKNIENFMNIFIDWLCYYPDCFEGDKSLQKILSLIEKFCCSCVRDMDGDESESASFRKKKIREVIASAGRLIYEEESYSCDGERDLPVPTNVAQMRHFIAAVGDSLHGSQEFSVENENSHPGFREILPFYKFKRTLEQFRVYMEVLSMRQEFARCLEMREERWPMDYQFFRVMDYAFFNGELHSKMRKEHPSAKAMDKFDMFKFRNSSFDPETIWETLGVGGFYKWRRWKRRLKVLQERGVSAGVESLYKAFEMAYRFYSVGMDNYKNYDGDAKMRGEFSVEIGRIMAERYYLLARNLDESIGMTDLGLEGVADDLCGAVNLPSVAEIVSDENRRLGNLEAVMAGIDRVRREVLENEALEELDLLESDGEEPA